jgi:phosphoglycolate phosphatase
MKIRAVMIDLDGTLADTAGEIASALNLALAQSGRAPLAHEEVAALVGRGVRTLVERALARSGGGDIDAVVGRFEKHYAALVATEAALYAGAREGLARLHEAKVPMSVVTNKPRFFTQRLLDHLGIAAYFAGFVSGDDGIERKPAGDMLLHACRIMGSQPAATLMLGDSDNDVLAARAAGCPVWCVPYGYNEGRGPETLRCDRVVGDLFVAAREILAQRQRGEGT